MRLLLATVLALLLAGVSGCGDDDEEIPAGETGVQETPAPADPHAASGKLVYDLPTGWQRAGGQDGMRYATIRIPLAEGDAGNAELAIFWQRGGMGTKEMNLERWAASIRDAEGRPSRPADAAIDEREIHGLKVTTFDLEGTFSSSMMGGAHGAELEDARMMCAIVEVPGSDSPYYVKAIGPAATMQAAQVDYEKFLTSLRLE